MTTFSGLFSIVAFAAALAAANVIGVTAGRPWAPGKNHASITWTRIGSYQSGGEGGTGTMEVLAYDPETSYVAVVESRAQVRLAITVVSLATPSTPTVVYRINMTDLGVPNSVAIANGVLAAAADAPSPFTKQDSGNVYFFNLTDGAPLTSVKVGPMPDMILFNKEGSKLYVAVEAEPASQEDANSFSDPNLGVNPDGAFGIVSLSHCRSKKTFTASYSELSIQGYINSLSSAQWDGLLAAGLRIDPRVTKATAAKDIEPEYIALSNDGKTAYVTLQENNAIMVVTLKPHKEAIKAIWPLGLKSWEVNPTDLDDRAASGVKRVLYPKAFAWFQPDTIAFEKIKGHPYLFIANEGDSKEEKVRFSTLSAKGANTVGMDTTTVANLDRYQVDPFFGIKGGYNASLTPSKQGPYERVAGYGGRSFSIIDATCGKLVYESGSMLEEIIEKDANASACFGCDRDRNVPQSRTDDSGPEPEALDVFHFEGRYYLALGLERQGGVMLFDVTTPSAPVFVEYIKSRNFDPALDTLKKLLASGSDLAPEGIKVIKAEDTPTGETLALVTNEISGSLAVYRVQSIDI